MKKSDMLTFIETMEEHGDIWTEEQVQDIYGDDSLEEALKDRMQSISIMGDILGKYFNR